MDNAEIRGLAGHMLGQLLYGNRSVESAVRAVLRIATIKEHTLWVAWAQLQLTDMADESGMAEAERAIEEAFPDLPHQQHIATQAKSAYDATRAGVGEAPPYRADIGDVERDASIFEADLLRKVTDNRFRQLAVRHRILNLVKNRVQGYLTMVERGKDPPL